MVSPLRTGWNKDMNYQIEIKVGGVTKSDLAITIDTTTLTSSLTEGASTAGYILDVTIRLTATEAKALATVTEWKKGGNGGVSL
ncbi:MAG: hypothetical protein LBU95_05555 [Rikenellaceae bacterium]|jgi:HSP20 family molecular chaperone IbpA|nr:hypothetical protein [Rikenellaceae bacterium]